MTAVLSRFIPSMKKFGFFISYTHPPPKLSGICLGLALSQQAFGLPQQAFALLFDVQRQHLQVLR